MNDHDTGDHRALAIAGVTLPSSPVVRQAIDFARERCEPYLFNHVMRSWLFAVRIGELQNKPHDGVVTAVATLLHDVTLNQQFEGPRRFEVEAADIGRDFARRAGLDSQQTQLIWDGIALNSTPSIGLFKEPEVALCTAGVCFDVVGLQFDVIPPEEVARVVAEFPRLSMKSQMAQCFCHIAETRPATTYDNFVRDFGERHVPGYAAPSSVDALQNAPFDD